MKFTLLAACLVAGVAYSSCFVHSMPKHDDTAAIECDPVGDYTVPHPDCTKYYQCSNGVLFVQNCPLNLYWNPEIEQCSFKHEVPECVGGTRPPVGPTDAPTTQAPVTTGRPVVTTEAPEVTTGAPEITTGAPEITTGAPEITTGAPEVTTGAPVTTEAPERTTVAEVTTRDPSNPCEDDGIYALPDLNDCASYTQCINGLAFPSTCASGLLFDPEIGKCNKEELVDCFIATTPVTTTEEPFTTEAPLCEPEGVYNTPFPQNCSLYILCANGIPIVQECAVDLSFDPIELTCVREEDSTCVEPTTTGAPEITTSATETTTAEPEVPTSTSRPPVRCENDGVYNIPAPGGDCTEYFICINRVPYIQTCATGTLFSPIAGQCVREENYTCSSEGTTAQPATTGNPATSSATDAPTTDAPVTTAAPTVPTTHEPVTTQATVEPTTPGSEFTCPADDNGELNYYPHPDSCSLFIMCNNGEFGGVFDCGTGYWFDSGTQACVKPENSDCKLSTRP